MFGFGKKRRRGGPGGPQARTIALFSAREQDIRNWRTEGKSWLWIANELDVALATVTAGAKRLGISARCRTPSIQTQDRRTRIVTARERGDTLEQIGQVEGITRERVRQILLKAGKAHLVSARHRVETIIKICPTCKKEFGGEWTKFEADQHIYCSHDCGVIGRRIPRLNVNLRRLKALEMRRQNLPWKDINAALGFSEKSNGMQGLIRRFAARFGLDTTWAEGKSYHVEDPGDEWFVNARQVLEQMCRKP